MIYSVLDMRYRRIVSAWCTKAAAVSRQVAQKELGWA